MGMRKSQLNNITDHIHNIHGGVASGVSQGQNYFNETPAAPYFN